MLGARTAHFLKAIRLSTLSLPQRWHSLDLSLYRYNACLASMSECGALQKKPLHHAADGRFDNPWDTWKVHGAPFSFPVP